MYLVGRANGGNVVKFLGVEGKTEGSLHTGAGFGD